MKRRDFFRRLGILTTAFTVLPAATTYARTWKPIQSLWVPNPEYVNAPYEVYFYVNNCAYLAYTEAGRPMLFKRSASKSDSIIGLPREPVRMLENPETGSWTEVPLSVSGFPLMPGKRLVVHSLASSPRPW